MFTKEATKNQVVDVVYNLIEYHKELYLPEAWIVSRDKQGYLAHIQQRATAATIGAFHLELNASRLKLFGIINELSPELIAKHFHQGKRKPPTLKSMLEDRVLAKSIHIYVHRRMDTMLQEIVKNQLALSWQVERRVLVKDYVVDLKTTPLTPYLSFRKTSEAVLYRLNLKRGDDDWVIQDKEIVALTNQPKGWIIADYKLYQLEHINGFLIKPFRLKEEVMIPAQSVQVYFRNFIMKVVNKVEIEADGFKIAHLDQLESCVLEPVQDMFTQHWILAVQMNYKDVGFGWNESRMGRTSLEFNEEEVRIVKVIRNKEQEAIFLKKLKAFPLQIPKDRQQFELDEKDSNPYALLEWLGRNLEDLKKAGFHIRMPVIDGKRLQLQSAAIDMKVESESDWFDLKGEIQVGNHTFPFSKLVKYIKEENRFFPLPDGNYFLIPEEWFSKYKGLADFGKKEGNSLRLAKSQYTLLDNFETEEVVVIEETLPVFVPSPLLKAKLRPYQLEGSRWLANLYHQDLGACLADDMGLGKTLQTIAILLYAKAQKATKFEDKKTDDTQTKGQQLGLFNQADDIDFLQPLQALIVLPSSLLFNWENEIKKFAPSLSIYQHYGPKRHKDARIIARYDTIITTYQTALKDVDILEKLNFEYIVLDESQQIKNRESKVFKALNTLNAAHKISLSGTPIENSLSDLWSQMQFINEGLLGSYAFFKKTFVTPIEKGQNEEKKQRLRQLVSPYLLRRTKEEVAKDLPPLITRVFYTEMTNEQRKFYEREKSAARNYLLDNFDAKNGQYRLLVLQTLTKLRQLVNHPITVDSTYKKGSGKFNDIIEQWEIVRQSGHKVLMFSSFVKHLELFKDEMEKRKAQYSWLSGSVPGAKRKQAIEKFQKREEVQSFLISIKTGGTGLNLTAADYVFILDPWWNPTTEQQAIARAHRIGQKSQVIALKFITKDSIEEKILKLQQRKSQLAEDIIGKTGQLDLDKQEIAFLLS